MQRVARKRLSVLLCTVGLCSILLGWGGAWGNAYGQTAGPTPTTGTVISPISVVKSVTPSNGIPNQEMVFSIQVRNNESTRQTNAIFTDRILDFLEVVSVSSTKGTATFSGQDVRVEIGPLDPGETVTITIVTRIRATALNGDTGVNIANVTTSQTSTTSSNPVAISVGQKPPDGLPNTGAPAAPNAWLIAFGALLVAGGSLLALRRAGERA